MTEDLQWLRSGRGYRAYVRGLRGFLSAFAAFFLLGVLGSAKILPLSIAMPAAVACFGVGVLSVLIGGIGWLSVPGKARIVRHSGLFIQAVVEDLFTGLPRRSQ